MSIQTLQYGRPSPPKDVPSSKPLVQLTRGRFWLINHDKQCEAYARTDVIAEGIIAGWKALQPQIPVAFCIHGTGEKRANQLIRDELGVEPYQTMDDALRAAIRMARTG